MAVSCDSCLKITPIIVQHSMTYKLCLKCNSRQLKMKQRLIEGLPNVVELEPFKGQFSNSFGYFYSLFSN